MYVLLFSFCCGRLQLTEAPQQRWPRVGRMGARQEEKEADGQGVSAWVRMQGFPTGRAQVYFE